MGRRAVEAEWGNFSDRLALRLRILRERSNLSQEDVAYRAGITRYTYQRLEKGLTRNGDPVNPTLRTLIAISQAMGVGLHELVPEDLPDLRP